jgi:hypothetical protein
MMKNPEKRAFAISIEELEDLFSSVERGGDVSVGAVVAVNE